MRAGSHHPSPAVAGAICRARAAVDVQSGICGTLNCEPNQLRFAQDASGDVLFAKAHDEYRAARRVDRTEVLQRYARRLATPRRTTHPLHAVRHQLAPVIRNLAVVLDVAHGADADDDAALPRLQFRAFGPDCVEVLAIDHAHATRTFIHAGRWLSANSYCYDEARRPVSFAPGAGEARERQRHLEQRLLNETYALQKASLDARNERQQRDLVIATYGLHQIDGEGLVSWCTWTNGVAAHGPDERWSIGF